MNVQDPFRGPVLVMTTAIVLLPSLGPIEAHAQDRQPARDAVWIYKDMPRGKVKDTRSDTEAAVAPFGFMPRERVNQIHVNVYRPIDSGDAARGTCIEYSFRFVEPSDWQGVHFLIDGDSWGHKPGINVKK